MGELICARCRTRVEPDEHTCPLCHANLRSLFAVRHRRTRPRVDDSGRAIGPPVFGDEDEEPLDWTVPRTLVWRGAYSGVWAGLALGGPSALITWALKSSESTPHPQQLVYAFVCGFLPVFAGAVVLGAKMGHEGDFSDDAAQWVVYGLSGSYVLFVLAMYRIYHLVPAAGCMPYVLRLLVGYLYRQKWGETWETG
ncbi:MAG TPA: hypothetical protein PLD23_14340 [Armatimonadota bacterium]|nr:hypothetical protein [Armatimonadota bacterium]